MQLQIAEALKQTGVAFHAELAEEIPVQIFNGREIRFLEPAQLVISYVYDGKGFQIIGEMTVLLLSVCARCGDAFPERLSFPIEERFVKEPREDEDVYSFHGDVLNLSSMVLDNLFLHLPIVSVCKEDCKGLCPYCGCNLNTTQCACEQEAIDVENPLAALQQLFTDGKEV